MAELKNPIKEAERYLQNAKQILSEKAEKDGNYYNDSKYVKMAGNLLALHAPSRAVAPKYLYSTPQFFVYDFWLF